ncbi:hypothetical protein JG688_00017820 [Phytophthora aleatoria]|uniref:Uncharacterized protein n=1 Tax=Phytophthora aleatoria TaxID=2496075 RepID=A0A8J5LYA1_9STRA|nr:hypothetical protein JG688_00017820 [Phytophthora aleatoria]
MIRASRVPTDSFHGVRHWELLAGCDVETRAPKVKAIGDRIRPGRKATIYSNFELSACVGEVARLIKQQHPREFKDIPAARIKLFALLKGGNYTPLRWDYKVKLPLDISSSEPWSVHYLLMEDLELDLNGKIADQLPSTTSETKISSTIWDLKIYLKKTHFLPAHFKLVLGKDGDQVVMCKEVGAPSRSEDVSNHLDSLAARKEIDLTRTVRGVFSDGHSWLDVDVLIVAIDDAALGKRKERSESFDDASHQNNISRQFVLQSVRSLTRLRGLSHVRNQISDFVPNVPDTIDSAVLVDWLIEYGRDWDFNWKAYVRFDCSEGMLKHLEEKRKSYPTTCPIVEAVATRRLDEVERLHCDASAYKIKVAMAEAARHNQVEVMQLAKLKYLFISCGTNLRT